MPAAIPFKFYSSLKKEGKEDEEMYESLLLLLEHDEIRFISSICCWKMIEKLLFFLGQIKSGAELMREQGIDM